MAPEDAGAARVPELVTDRASLGEVARLFLKLGTTAFGGPAAHIAMMEDEVVRRRQWLTREEFLDYLGATNLIPGPNSTELAIHIGHARAGWAGLVVAGASFILPAAAIVSAIAWAYVRYGQLPATHGILYGVKPVVIAVVLQALWGLARSAVRSRWLGVVGVAAMVATMLGVNELAVLVAAGVLAAAVGAARRRDTAPSVNAVALSFAPSVGPGWSIARFARQAGGVAASVGAGAGLAAPSPFSLGALFLVFAKVGAVLFGSGYVLLAFLRADLVTRLGWLTERQLLDAVAVGQVTPGPVFTTATFIGYLLGGPSGAVVATIGIFLPAFFFVAVSGRLVPRLRRSPAAGDVLDGVNVASLALKAVVTAQLGRAALVDPLAVALALASAVLLLRFRVGSAWLVVGGAVIGVATNAWR
jgi:chromate transporter